MFAPSATSSGGAFDIITPTSIASAGSGSSASIRTNGSVTFSLVSTLSLNGVFSAAYDNYHIVVQFTTGVNIGTCARLRASGVDATVAADYTNIYLWGANTALSVGAPTPAGRWDVLYGGSGTRNGLTMQVHSPFKAVPTGLATEGHGGYDNASNTAFWAMWGTHKLSVSYDGITLFPETTSTLTGTVAVYGLGI